MRKALGVAVSAGVLVSSSPATPKCDGNACEVVGFAPFFGFLLVNNHSRKTVRVTVVAGGETVVLDVAPKRERRVTPRTGGCASTLGDYRADYTSELNAR